MKGYLKQSIVYEGYGWNKIGPSVEAMNAFLAAAPQLPAIGFTDKEGVVEYERQWQVLGSIIPVTWLKCSEYEFNKQPLESCRRIVAVPSTVKEEKV